MAGGTAGVAGSIFGVDAAVSGIGGSLLLSAKLYTVGIVANVPKRIIDTATGYKNILEDSASDAVVTGGGVVLTNEVVQDVRNKED